MPLHTLLLVDPSPKTQAEARAMFADEPIAVEVAADGQQALEQIEAHRPNVVLVCAKAAGIDGYAIAHYVAHTPHLRSVSVLLVMTPRAVDERRIRESGAKGYLVKPLRAGVVIPRVRAALVHPPARKAATMAKVAKAAKPARVPKPAKTVTPPKAAAPPKTVALSKSPTPATPEALPITAPPAAVPEGREFDKAFDAIDATMKRPNHADGGEKLVLTQAELAQIVAEAVSRAIADHERARGAAPSPATAAAPAPAAGKTHTPRPGDLRRLQHEMGLDDLSLDEAPPPPARASAKPEPAEDLRRLQHEMGLDDVALGDAPPAATPVTPPAAASFGEVALEDAAAAAFGQDRPDEGLEWLAEQLHVHEEPKDDYWPPSVAETHHLPAAEPFRQAVEAVRAGVAHLSSLVHHHHPKAHEPAAAAPQPAPHEAPAQAPAPEAGTRPAKPPRSTDADDIRFTFDPLPPLPPSLLGDPDKK